MLYLASALVAYFLGSIPWGYLAGKLNGIDLHNEGSGSTGATNALRVLGKPWGYTVFALDALKGWLAVMAAFELGTRFFSCTPGQTIPAGVVRRFSPSSDTATRCGCVSVAARASRPPRASCWRSSPGRSSLRAWPSGSCCFIPRDSSPWPRSARRWRFRPRRRCCGGWAIATRSAPGSPPPCACLPSGATNPISRA